MNKKVRSYAVILVTIVFFAFQMYLALVKQLTSMLHKALTIARGCACQCSDNQSVIR